MENTAEKVEIARNEQFHLFPLCFQRLVLQTHKNKGLFGKGLEDDEYFITVSRTQGRKQTFYDGTTDGAPRGICHIPLAEPFCPVTSEVLKVLALNLSVLFIAVKIAHLLYVVKMLMTEYE